MKSQRQSKILELINKYDIETQEELTQYLAKEGFVATQATVSRDIKELRLIKVSTGEKHGRQNKYKYAANTLNSEIDTRLGNKFKNILSEAVTKINCAGHLVVLKTYAGTAQAAAVAIDALEVPTLIGCVAGDDTIIIVMATENDARDFMKKLSKSIKG